MAKNPFAIDAAFTRRYRERDYDPNLASGPYMELARRRHGDPAYPGVGMLQRDVGTDPLPISEVVPGQFIVKDTIPEGPPMYFPFSSEGMARNFALRKPERRTVHSVTLGEAI